MKKKIIVALASIGMGLAMATSVNAVAAISQITSTNTLAISSIRWCQKNPDECWCGYRGEDYICIPY